MWEQRAEYDKNDKLPYNALREFDETWIVFDTEHAKRQGRLKDGIRMAVEHGIQIAHSSPCFEFWLSLHYELKARPMTTSRQACALFEEVAGLKKGSYSKTTGAASNLIHRLIFLVPTAVRNAERLPQHQYLEPFSATPSTSVQSLVRSMHETLPEAMKDRFPLPQ